MALPRFVPPMLAELRTTVPRGPEWLYEAKLDGYRIQAAKDGRSVRLYSRRGNDLTATYPHVAAAVAGIEAKTALLDGEIVAIDEDGRPSFQALQHRSSQALPVVYYAFDLLQRESRDLRTQPLEARKVELVDVIEQSSVYLSETLSGNVDAIIKAIQGLQLEGIIAKRRTSPYRSSRSDAWIKVKFLNRQELVIAAYRPGLGNFESLVVGYYEAGKLRYAGKVRSGFTPHSRSEIWRELKPLETQQYPFAELPTGKKTRWGEGLTLEDLEKLRWVKPTLVAEVAFVEWTRDGHLRHPKFVGLRHDKPASDIERDAG